MCGGSASQSAFSKQDNVFTYGGDGVERTRMRGRGRRQGHVHRERHGTHAIRFPRDPIDSTRYTDSGSEPIPLYVEFTNRTKCGVLSHDHAQHWGKKFSWYGCSDNSELLTDEHIADPFDGDSAARTVQRSTDKGKPV